MHGGARWPNLRLRRALHCFFTAGHAQLARGGIQLLAAAATSGTSWDQSVSTVGVGSSERGHSTGAQPF